MLDTKPNWPSYEDLIVCATVAGMGDLMKNSLFLIGAAVVMSLLLVTSSSSQKIRPKDFEYLIRASNILSEANLKGDSLTEQGALELANVLCNTLTQLGKDKNFEELLNSFANSKLSQKDRANVQEILRDISKFAEFSAKEYRLLREGGLTEKAANAGVAQLWRVRSEMWEFKIDPALAMNAVRSAGEDICRDKDDIKSARQLREKRNASFKIIGGSITVINGVLGPSTFGALAIISIAGGILGVIFS